MTRADLQSCSKESLILALETANIRHQALRDEIAELKELLREERAKRAKVRAWARRWRAVARENLMKRHLRNWKKRLERHLGRLRSAFRKQYDDRFGIPRTGNKRVYDRSRQTPDQQ